MKKEWKAKEHPYICSFAFSIGYTLFCLILVLTVQFVVGVR
jgi:hypothetical protein